MRDFAALKVSVVDQIATVSLNRPEVLNALNRMQRLDLAEALGELGADANVRVIILRGEGRAFCAGQDQKESAGMDAAAAHDRIEHYAQLYARFRELTKPVIARLHGPVAGAGLQLALLSDLRIAAADTRLGMTELNIGSAAITGSALLVPVVGEAAMKRMVLTGEFVNAEEALRTGLVHEVLAADQLDARVRELAVKIAAKPPGGMALTKNWWRVMTDAQFAQTIQHAHEAHAKNFAAGAFSKGSAAFVAGKRG